MGTILGRAERLRIVALLVGVGLVLAPAAAQAASNPPPVPSCFATGSGYGTCQGNIIPGGGTIQKLATPNAGEDRFRLTGPSPLQSTKPVVCNNGICLYHHLDWILGGGASRVSGCAENQTTCQVRVSPSSKWTPVYVRQDNEAPIVFALFDGPLKQGIEGTVRVVNDRGLPPAQTAVKGASVQITGPHFKDVVAVSRDGSYKARVPKAGAYVVYPRLPAAVTRGLDNPVMPVYRDVSVSRGGTATADFTVKDNLRLAIDLSEKEVSADGLHLVTATITAHEFGKELAGLPVAVMPLGQHATGSVLEDPVPAAVCVTRGRERIWPELSRGPSASLVYVTRRTDARGEISLTIAMGTVPGDFELQAWAEKEEGGLDTTHDTLDVNPEAHIRITPTKRAGGTFAEQLKTYLKIDPSVSLPSDAKSLADTLAKLSAEGHIGDFSYAPIRSSGGTPYEAVLVYPDDQRFRFDALGNIESSSPGEVLSGTNLPPTVSLTTVARDGALKLPTLANWLAGNPGPQYSVPGIAGPATTDGINDYNYFGFGYPQAAGCS